MRSHRTKTAPEEILESATAPLSAVRHGARRQTLLKAVLIAGGVAALTAGSTAISSLRRRMEPTS